MSEAVRLSETVLGADDPDFKDRQWWLNRWMEQSPQNAGKLLFINAAFTSGAWLSFTGDKTKDTWRRVNERIADLLPTI